MKTAVHVPAKYRLPTSSNPHCTPTVVSTHAVPQNLDTGGRVVYQSPGDAIVRGCVRARAGRRRDKGEGRHSRRCGSNDATRRAEVSLAPSYLGKVHLAAVHLLALCGRH